MPKRKADTAVDPNKLVRRAAGSYRTADDRFEVREADVGWFLVDPEHTNEFGQELSHGPYATLKAVREAMPAARERQPAPMRPRPSKKSKAKAYAKAPKPEAPVEPPSWIDELPSGEGKEVRRLIGALETEGLTDAEELVRRDRDGLLPAVAVALIERRLAAIVEEAPSTERKRAADLVRRAAEILSSEGSGQRGPLPGWSLVETDPPHRRIDLRE